MTLIELAAEYRAGAELLKRRIAELRLTLENESLCEMDRFRLRGRICALTSMYRDTTSTALVMERYYAPGGRANERRHV